MQVIAMLLVIATAGFAGCLAGGLVAGPFGAVIGQAALSVAAVAGLLHGGA